MQLFEIHVDARVNGLTPSWWKSLSYRNHSIDLLCKPMDWFLYDRGLLHERVKLLRLKYHRTIGFHMVSGGIEVYQWA